MFALHPSVTGDPVFVRVRGDEVEAFLAALDAGRYDQTLLAALADPPNRTLRRARDRRDRRDRRDVLRIGVEHEFRVFDEAERQVDFPTLMHSLGIDGVRADPTDPNAYRCAWGGVITADGAEAELATPPFVVQDGFVGEVLASVEAGTRALAALLAPELRLEGYSTHINVSSSTRRDVRLARRYAQTFAPALMLLLDGPESPGLLVRPRPGRLELCGEYAAGAGLGAAVAFAAASVGALQHESWAANKQLRVQTSLEPATERFGFYVDRTAFGSDLYRSGRATPLRLRRATVTAGEHLAMCWTRVSHELTPHAQSDDLRTLVSMVNGSTGLPCELPGDQSAVAL